MYTNIGSWRPTYTILLSSRNGNVLFGVWALIIIIITINYDHFGRSGWEVEM